MGTDRRAAPATRGAFDQIQDRPGLQGHGRTAMSVIFSIRDMTVRFGGLTAVNRLSMDVEEGAIHALIGPNGAGQSTVFNCISRFYTPVEGRIDFAGRSLLRMAQHEIVHAGIARTFQNL